MFQMINLCKAEREIKLIGTDMLINRIDIHMIAIYTEMLSIAVFIIYLSYLD